jgi:uncharacterized protein YndB with AHSA1/START domain
MSTTTEQATQVYQLFIKASPERIWDAITQTEFTQKYFHGGSVSWEDGRRRSFGPDGSTWNDEAVIEWDPPHRLVHGWRSLYDPEMALEEESRVTWEIEDRGDGVSLLTVTHDRLENAPKTAASVGGVGWMQVLSGLKTLLETGEPLNG